MTVRAVAATVQEIGSHFRKLHGSGNDFILLTDSPDLHRDWAGTARLLCDRRIGVGADGLVITARRGAAPNVLDVVCCNADGSIATMCGNALRCAAWCAGRDYGLTEMTLVMAGVEHQAQIRDDGVWVTAELGAVDPRCVHAVVDGRQLWFDSAHTGTEHVVAIVADVDGVDVDTVGRLIRHHHDLVPLGTNVNFVQVAGPRELRIRTYERGVEAETLSCGSGAVAAVVVATRHGLVDGESVIVHNRSGTPLTVRPHRHRRDTSLWVGGPVTYTYRGELA